MNLSKIYFILLYLIGSSSALASETINYDFCSLLKPRPLGQANTDLELWNANAVQQNTFAAATDQQIRDTPLASYPTSYVKMTAVRDIERCNGTLKIKDRETRLIGDLLADFMSRWLVLSIKQCNFDNSNSADTGICGSMRRSYRDRLGTLESAMDMTSVYLSSHMGSALIAVIYNDAFWNQEYPRSTHCLSRPCSSVVTKERIKFLRRYKPDYDLNNRFLAKNISTVMSSLKDSCLLRGNLATIGAQFLEHLPLQILFEQIRNATFEAALSAALTAEVDNHPMLSLVNGKFQAQYNEFSEWDLAPKQITDAEQYARTLFANSIIQSGLSRLGSMSWEELAEKQPSKNPVSCVIKMTNF